MKLKYFVVFILFFFVSCQKKENFNSIEIPKKGKIIESNKEFTPSFKDFCSSFTLVQEFPYTYTDSIGDYTEIKDAIPDNCIKKYISSFKDVSSSYSAIEDEIEDYLYNDRISKYFEGTIQIYKRFSYYLNDNYIALVFAIYIFQPLQPMSFTYFAIYQTDGTPISLEKISDSFDVPSGWEPTINYSKVTLKTPNIINCLNITNSWSRSSPEIYPETTELSKYKIDKSGNVLLIK